MRRKIKQRNRLVHRLKVYDKRIAGIERLIKQRERERRKR